MSTRDEINYTAEVQDERAREAGYPILLRLPCADHGITLEQARKLHDTLGLALGRGVVRPTPPGTADAMADVLVERARQNAKWGEQNHDPFAYLTILMEEVGELAQAALHTRYGGRAGGLVHMREEAVQAAAVAVAIVECLDRGKWRWGGHAAPGEPQERVVGVLHEAAIECGRPACSWCYRQTEGLR